MSWLNKRFTRIGYALTTFLFMTIVPIGPSWIFLPAVSFIVWGFWVIYIAPPATRRAFRRFYGRRTFR